MNRFFDGCGLGVVASVGVWGLIGKSLVDGRRFAARPEAQGPRVSAYGGQVSSLVSATWMAGKSRPKAQGISLVEADPSFVLILPSSLRPSLKLRAGRKATMDKSEGRQVGTLFLKLTKFG